MEIFDSHYKLSKISLTKIGLWPYLKSFIKIRACIFFVIINCILGIPQILYLFQRFSEDALVTIENAGANMFFLAIIGKYLALFLNSQQLALLFDRMAKDWQRLIAKPDEREIMEKYKSDGRMLSNFYAAYIVMGWVVYTNIPYIPLLLDLIKPLNESRTLVPPMYGNFIVFDAEENHYVVCLLMSAIHIVNIFLFCGVDSTYIISVKHCCGLFDIVCYRLEHLIKTSVIAKENELKCLIDKKEIDDKLRQIVVLHNEAISCTNLIEDSFNICFLLLNCLSTIGFGLIGVYMILIHNNFLLMIRALIVCCGTMIHHFFVNYIGQQIIDSSSKVHTAAYSNKWYLIPIQCRKYIVLILYRAYFPCKLTAGKLGVLCLATFGSLIKTAASYFAVFISLL